MYGNRSYKLRIWCAGSGGSESGNAVLFCYRDLGVESHLLGNKDEPRGRGKKAGAEKQRC